METKQNTCRFIAHTAMAAGESLLLPQHTEQLVGLLYLREGSGLLNSGNNLPVTLEAKSALLYPGWQRHRLTICEEASLLLCAFRCEVPEEVLRSNGGRTQDCRELPNSQWTLSQLDAFTPGLDRASSVQAASHLLSILLGQSRRESEESPSYVQVIRTIIDTRFSEDLTLDVLASHVGKSKFHLSRAFRDCYQMTPNAYLTSVRLCQAARLLTETDLPVREIGRRVGISNSSYFTAQFKRRYGCSPREYRFLNKSVGGK